MSNYMKKKRSQRSQIEIKKKKENRSQPHHFIYVRHV